MLSVMFSNALYYRSHFRNPRGTGTWAFDIAGDTHFFNGSLAECKKQARARAREVAEANGRDFILVSVLP